MKRYRVKYNKAKKSFVDAMGMVNEPAIEQNFLKFSKVEKSPFVFSTQTERREVLGPAMIPDIDIYRKDNEGNEFNLYFTKEDIREYAKTFFEGDFNKSLNINHTSEEAKGYIFQSYIVDKERGIDAPPGIDVPDGSWMLGVAVTNDELWSDIKGGKVNGFSIEMPNGDLEEDVDGEVDVVKLSKVFKDFGLLIQHITTTTK